MAMTMSVTEVNNELHWPLDFKMRKWSQNRGPQPTAPQYPWEVFFGFTEHAPRYAWKYEEEEEKINVKCLMSYAQACLKCTECGRGPDNDTPMMLGPKVWSDQISLKRLFIVHYSRTPMIYIFRMIHVSNDVGQFGQFAQNVGQFVQCCTIRMLLQCVHCYRTKTMFLEMLTWNPTASSALPRGGHSLYMVLVE